MRRFRSVFGETLVLESLPEKMKGLMFKRAVEKPLLFVFPREATAENSIHSFFCPHFDAVFLDAKGVVVGLEEVRSSRPYIAPKKPFKFLFETFPGHIRRKKIRLGMKMAVDF